MMKMRKKQLFRNIFVKKVIKTFYHRRSLKVKTNEFIFAFPIVHVQTFFFIYVHDIILSS